MDHQQIKNKPEFWRGVSAGIIIANMQKRREIISESEAAKITPGVHSAHQFRRTYVLGKEQHIEPVQPPDSDRFYYYRDEVEQLGEKFKKMFNREDYLVARKNKRFFKSF